MRNLSPMCRRTLAVGVIVFAVALLATAQTDDLADVVRLERTLSTAHALPGSVFRVCIQIEPQQDLNGVGVRETLPLGWTLHPVEMVGAAFKRSENEWVFPETLEKGSTHRLVYEVTVPPADKLYSDPLPACFEFSGTFQTTVPAHEIEIPGDTVVEVVTALPIPTAVAHLIPATLEEADRIDLRLDQRIHGKQFKRALDWWSTDSVVPWTEGAIIDLAMMQRLTALFETCTDVDEMLPASIDPELVAVRSINTFLPCDSVLLPEGCLDPGPTARQFEVKIEVSGSHDTYAIGLSEWFPEAWRVTPVVHEGFTYRPSRTEWIYPGRVRKGETVSVRFVVEVIASVTDQLDTFAGCCGSEKQLDGFVLSGLECSQRPIVGESVVYVWNCLPVLLTIARWDVDEDRLDATLSDHVTFPQVQRAMDFWLSGTPVPHTCGYTVGYHMLKRIVAHWNSGVPVTEPLPGTTPSPCDPEDGCYVPTCPDGAGLCHLSELQSPDEFVGLPDPPKVSIDIEGVCELTCAVSSTTLRAAMSGGTPPYRFEWRGPGGELLATTEDFVVEQPGTYTAIGISVGGCRVGKQIKVSRDVEAPQVRLEVGESLSCAVDQVTVLANVLGGRPPFEIRWEDEHGRVLGRGSHLLVSEPQTITAHVVGANGCASSASAIVVEDRQPPIVDAGPGQVLTCRIPSVTLVGSVLEGQGPYTFTWTNDAGRTVSSEATVTVDAPGSYTFTAVGANGCAASNAVTVYQDTAVPTIDASVSGALTCANPLATLSAIVNGGVTPESIVWTDAAGTIVGMEAAIEVDRAGTYTVTATGTNGCSASETVVVALDVAKPIVSASADGVLTCDVDQVKLVAEVSSGRSPYEIVWANESGDSVGCGESVLVDEPGEYTVSVTGANGCSTSGVVIVEEDTLAPSVEAIADAQITCSTPLITLDADIEGGRTPYDIAWTDASGAVVGRTKTVTVQHGGTYTITVTGANGCKATDHVAVSEDTAAPTVRASVSGELTCDATQATLTASISGGRAPYTIAWRNASGATLGAKESIIVGTPGEYTVKVTGANGCSADDCVTVVEDAEPPIVAASASGELTCDTSQVTLTATIEGRRQPLEIAWTDAADTCVGSTESIAVREPGRYSVTVTDANGCVARDDVRVIEDVHTPIVVASASGDLTCATPEATLTVAIEGGRQPLEIAWTDAAGTCVGSQASITTDDPGTYTVTVTGANGCSAADTVTVEQDTGVPSVEAAVSGALTCDRTQVTLSAVIEGGRPPYEIEWADESGEPAGSTELIVITKAGSYEVTVTGANGCSASDTVVVEDDTGAPTVETAVNGMLACDVDRVSLSVAVGGGRSPYQILWTDASGARVGTTESVEVGLPGNYDVTVTGANGCSAHDTVTVQLDRATPVVEAEVSGAISCATPTVLLTSTITGGRPPFTCVWSDCCGTPLGTGREWVAREPGPYEVTVTGANGCSSSDTVVVEDGTDAPIIGAVAGGMLTCNVDHVSLSVTIDGGRSPYQILWTDASGTQIGTSESVAVGLLGYYEVTVTGANGCSASDSVTVHRDVAAPRVEATASGALTCSRTQATLSAAIEGGRPPYEIEWVDASGAHAGSTELIVVTVAGAYTVRVTGANGCSASDTVVVEDDTGAPTVEAVAGGMLNCNVDHVSLSVTIDGGRSPYQILWTDASGARVGTTESVSVGLPGSYSVTVTGANGCSAHDSVIVELDQATPVVEITASGEITCVAPTVLLTSTITGGRPPFTCVWNDCCGTALGTGREFIASEPGMYVVTVTGRNGCSSSASIEVHEDRTAPTVELASEGSLTCTHHEVRLTVAVSGGRPPYMLSWLDPQSASFSTLGEVFVSIPGVYTVTAVGENGCSASATVFVTENMTPPALDLGPDIELTCEQPDAVLAARPYGGSPPYTYLWTDDHGNPLAWEAELVVSTPGTYVAMVIGSNGCSVSDTIVVRDGIEPPTVELGPNCEIDCCTADIELKAVVTGGVAPYSYEWYDECGVLVGTEETLRATEPGIYLLIVRTADGCIASDSIEVLEPEPSP